MIIISLFPLGFDFRRKNSDLLFSLTEIVGSIGNTMKLLPLIILVVGLFVLQGSHAAVIGNLFFLCIVGDSQSDAIISRNILLKKIEDSETSEDVFAFAEEVSSKYRYLFRMAFFLNIILSQCQMMGLRSLGIKLTNQEVCMTDLTDTGDTPQRGQRN